jgi:hypothetical protein
MCGGVGLFEINIALSEVDGAKALADKGYLEQIAVEIADNPQKYSAQSISIYGP